MTFEEIKTWVESVDGDVEILPEDVPLVNWQDGEWVADHKYEHLEGCIIKDTSTDKFYEISMSRAGSAFTDWDYFYHGVIEVEPKEVKRVAWIPVVNPV